MKNNKVLALRPLHCWPYKFKWPKLGKVRPPKDFDSWDITNEFWGLLWGEGCFDLLELDLRKKFLVLEVDKQKISKEDGCISFPECKVVYCGSIKKATEIILKANPKSRCPGSGKNYYFKGFFKGQNWYKDGKLHREDGPAVIYANGEEYWYKNGELHNDNGPAIVFPNISQHWFKNGLKHREDGPADIYFGGKVQYWLNDEKFSKKEFNQRIKLLKGREIGV